MSNTHILKATLFALIIVFISCGKEYDFQPMKEYPGVEASLWVYFEKFEIEAARRGVDIDLATTGITGSIEKIHAEGTIGLCNHRFNEPNHVIIDKDFWESASENSKELIVFHELGHCYLSRGHNDSKKDDGTCASIMRSGRGGCVDFYNRSNKGGYLDELYLLGQNQ